MATLVDTNLLLRTLQPSSPQHAIANSAVTKLRKQQTEMCAAPQNFVEFWVVATRPMANNGLGMDQQRIAGEIQALRGLFRILEGKPGITGEWEKLVSANKIFGKLAHDAHLVATMKVHGVTNILTFNVADFERFPGITVLDPVKI